MTAVAPARSDALRSPVSTLAKRGVVVGALSAYGIPMLSVEVFGAVALAEGEAAAAAGWALIYFIFSAGAALVWALLGAAAGAVAGSLFPFLDETFGPRTAAITAGAVEGLIVGVATGVGIGLFFTLQVATATAMGFGAALVATGTAAWALRDWRESAS